MKFKEYKIGELITQVRGVTYKKEDVSKTPQKDFVPLIKANNITNDFQLVLDNLIYIHKSKVKQRQLLKAGDVIIVTSSGSNKIVGKGAVYNLNSALTFGAFCKVLRPKDNIISPKLLSHFFQTDFYRKTISNLARGANINNLKNEHIDNLTIKFSDSLQIQEQIVSVLEKAKTLIRNREQSLVLLDDLLRATFLDQFGDPVLNNKNWEKVKMKDVVSKFTTGKSLSSVDKANAGDYKVLKTSSVSWGEFQPKESKYLPFGYVAPEKHLVNKGDLLISRMNTRELVGASTYVFDEVKNLALPDRIWKFEWRDLRVVNPLFIWYTINTQSFRREISQISTGTSGSMKNISQAKFLSLNLILPDKSMQDEFGKIALKIQIQKRILREGLVQKKNLFQSLLQDVFSGKLELKDDKVELQEALNNVKWLGSQISEITSNKPAQDLMKLLNTFNKKPKAFETIIKLQETLTSNHLPALDMIKNLQKTLTQNNIPDLRLLNSLDKFNWIQNNNLLKQITNNEPFGLKSIDAVLVEKKQKELEEELRKENDPILQFINQEQIGKLTVNNYKVNVPKAIYTYFGTKEFEIIDVVEALKVNKALFNINKRQLKKDLFQVFREFIQAKFYGLFAFNDMRNEMKRSLFNPSFKLLQEFIESELKKKKNGLTQVYINELHKDPSDPYYNDKTMLERDRIYQLRESRVYLEYKIDKHED